MKKIIFFSAVLFFMLGNFATRAQYDPLYNQYSFDQLMINPAYAGANDVFTINSIFRRQWNGIDGAPQTLSLTGHTSIANNNAGVGLTVINETFGVNNNTEVYGSFAYKITLGRGALSMGVSAGYLSYKYDYTQLNLEFLNDPSFIPVDEQVSQTNFGAGLWYQSEKYYAGISVPRILEVDVDRDDGTTSNRYRRHIYLSGGGLITLSSSLKLKPYGLVRIINGLPANIDIGASLLFSELIWAGILIRDLDAIALIGQLEVSDKVRVGLSIELPTTKLISTSYGTYEVMVALDFAAFGSQVLKRRYF